MKRRRPVPDASYECLACGHDWRGMRGEESCPACWGKAIDHLNVVHPEELLLPPGSPLPPGVPSEIPNSAIYLHSEERSGKRLPRDGRLRIRRPA